MDFLAGAKTYIGLALSLFGGVASTLKWDWWGGVADDVSVVLNALVMIAGTGLGIYGKIMASKREKAAKAAAGV